MGKIYLITGAAGHLGNVIIRKLLEERKKVRALVLPGETNIPKGDYEVFYGDVRNKESLKPFFRNAEGYKLIVVHCAGIVSIASKYQQIVYDTNVNGTRNVVELALENDVEKFIYVSSVHAIPEKPNEEIISETNIFDPDKVVGLYAKTKAEATKIVLEGVKNGLRGVVVHPSGISGPYDNGRGHLTTMVVDYCNRKLTSSVGGGYDIVDVRDVAQGIISCSEKGRIGECYILSNQYFTAVELLKMLHEITGQKEIKRVLPLWFVKITARLAELYYRILKQPPLFTSYSIYTLNTNSRFSHEKANKELGYTTRDMRETLSDTVNWLKSQGRIK